MDSSIGIIKGGSQGKNILKQLAKYLIGEHLNIPAADGIPPDLNRQLARKVYSIIRSHHSD